MFYGNKCGNCGKTIDGGKGSVLYVQHDRCDEREKLDESLFVQFRLLRLHIVFPSVIEQNLRSGATRRIATFAEPRIKRTRGESPPTIKLPDSVRRELCTSKIYSILHIKEEINRRLRTIYTYIFQEDKTIFPCICTYLSLFGALYKLSQQQNLHFVKQSRFCRKFFTFFGALAGCLKSRQFMHAYRMHSHCKSTENE